MPATKLTESQLNQLLLNLPVGLTIQRADGRLFYANERGARLLGFNTAADMQAAKDQNPLDHFSIFTESGDPYPFEELPSRRILDGRVKTAESVMKYELKKLGETRWSHVKSIGLFDESGKLDYVVNMIEDITEIKETESRLRDANARITKILEGVMVHDELAA